VNVIKNGFQIAARYVTIQTKYAVLRDLMLGTFEDFFRARWYFFTSGQQGTFLNTFIRELTVVGDAFGAMARFFAGGLQLLLYLAVPFYLSWQVTAISLASVLVLACPFLLLGKVNYRLGKLNTMTANQLSAVIHESLNSVKVILGFSNRQKSLAALTRAFDTHRHATVRSQSLSMAIPLLYAPLGLSVLMVALFSSQAFSLPLSETGVLLFSLLKIVPSVGELAAQKNSLDNFFPSYEQVISLRERAKRMRQPTGQRTFHGFDRAITLEGLSFAYPGHVPILTDINLHIPKGKMAALVGESGSGKSTLIDMLMGFHEPSAGGVNVDGIPLQEFDIESYRRRIGYVPQDSLLFNTSIRENLRWAKEDATDEEIRQACRQANADEFIERLRDGYETVVGDRGVRLSGGQIQRIALARAILRKPDLLILDEATSSLDSASERLIQQAIENIARATTVIVIAHRLSSIVNANYIYVLARGRIAEEGTYEVLVHRDGPFSRMVQHQTLEAATEPITSEEPAHEPR
jgi:ATP-binding cassette subfamily B protein